MAQPDQPIAERPPIGRLLVGGVTLIFAQSLPLFVPLVLASELQSEVKTVVSGSLLFGLPEVGSFIAVSILGKPGYDWLQARTVGLIKSSALTMAVGPIRYYTGISILCALLIFGIIEPYVSDLLPAAIQINRRFYMSIADTIFVVNLFVLGGDFWDKLRALFVYDAKAKFH
jgi:hypothetical protein